MYEGIGAAVSTIIVVIFLAAVGRSGRSNAQFDPQRGEFVLRSAAWIRWLVLGCCAILGPFGAAAATHGVLEGDPKSLWAGLGIALLGFGGGLVLHRELTSTIVADGLGLRRQSWGSVITMAWDDVERVTWSKSLSSVVFEDAAGKRLRVGNMMQGLADFEMLCRNRLGAERVADAFRRLRDSGFG